MGVMKKLRELGYREDFVTGALWLPPHRSRAAKARRKRMGQYRQKNKPSLSPAGSGYQKGQDPMLEGHFPAILDFLTDSAGPGKERIQTATLSCSFDAGVFKVGLNDRQASRTAWASGRTAQEAIQSLEEGLQAGEVEWRAWTDTWKKRGRG